MSYLKRYRAIITLIVKHLIQTNILLSFLVNDVLVADSLEKLMENKVVKEKKQELEKKLEVLRKKHEKERQRLMSSDDKSRAKFYTNKLVKRLSSKNM